MKEIIREYIILVICFILILTLNFSTITGLEHITLLIGIVALQTASYGCW